MYKISGYCSSLVEIGRREVKYVKSLQTDRRIDRRANVHRTKIIRIAHLGIRYRNKRHMDNIGHLNNNSHTNTAKVS